MEVDRYPTVAVGGASSLHPRTSPDIPPIKRAMRNEGRRGREKMFIEGGSRAAGQEETGRVRPVDSTVPV
jgi:hypothetical protein